MKKFDLEDVKHTTYLQKERLKMHVKLTELYLSDPEKERRLAKQECVICYYGTRIGGAAMTQSNCKLCDTTLQFSSTNVDRLCKPCAKEHGLCKHCSADIEYKERKKL